MQRGAIILCGGRSSRLAADKALLPFGSESMLARVVRIVGVVVDPTRTVIVAAAGQRLPPLAAPVVRDRSEFKGPLAGIRRGAEALAPDVETVFISGCDTPLLLPSVIHFLFEQIDDVDCALPEDSDRLYPLCGVYRKHALHQVIADRTRSLHRYVGTLKSRRIPTEQLRTVDPDLNSLWNVNTHDDYLAALSVAGLSTP